MPRYKLTIAYDGTNFCGWQKQEPPAGGPVGAEKVMGDAPPPTSDEPDGRPRVILRTVQEVVERAAREVVREPVILMGASRTDSGVHARGQVAAFTCSDGPATGWPLDRGTERLVLALNSRLPEDVLVTAAEPAAHDFNPIGGAVSKAYSYTLAITRTRPLWERNYVYQLWSDLDIPRMNDAAARLVGEHDFAAFAAAGHGRLTTIRTIFDCRVVELPPSEATQDSGPTTQDLSRPRRIRIDISGNGFLWNMVRIIAGTLVDVGRGRMSPDDVTTALTTLDRRAAGPTLPARGLCLEWVKYE